MKTIWLDVTTTLRWDRPAVGIVRVEYELIKYAMAHLHNQVRFFYFNTNHDTFMEISSADINKAMEKSDAKTVTTSNKKPSIFFINKKLIKHYAISILKSGYHLVFSILNPDYFVKTRYVMIKAYIKTKECYKKIKNKNFKVDSGGKKSCHLFKTKDIIILSGLVWNHGNVYQMLYDAKKDKDLYVVSFCYDIVPILHPQYCGGDVSSFFLKYLTDLAWASSLVFCISKNTEDDFRRLLSDYMVPVPKTQIVKLGAELLIPPERNTLNVIKKPFILFVSTIEPRKNHDTLYKAYTYLIDNGHIDLPEMVFVGMIGWTIGELVSIIQNDPRVKDKITILNRVSDAELANLYQHCLFTLYPSFYEGWGLPVAESLSHGKFCLASSTSSLPEVGGTLTEYIHPLDTLTWAEKILFYYQHPEAVQAREALIKQNYQAPTWDAFATLVFSSALENHATTEQ